MRNPCAFSPEPPQARAAAEFYAKMFPTGGTVLELGFGQGFFLEAASSCGLRVLGIDRDEQLVAEARDRGHDVQLGDARDIAAVVREPVDGILAAHLIEHFWPDAVQQLFNSAAQIVKLGGAVVIVTPNMRDWRVVSEWFWLDPTHIRPYPPGALKQLIDPASWAWDAEGYEPVNLALSRPRLLLQRLRFGNDYGRPGRWYRLRRH